MGVSIGEGISWDWIDYDNLPNGSPIAVGDLSAISRAGTLYRFAVPSASAAALLNAADAQAIRTAAGLEWIGAYTWTNRPDAATNSGKQITVTDFGGAIFRSNGTRWRAIAPFATSSNTPVSCDGTTNPNTLATITVAQALPGASGLVRLTLWWAYTNSGSAKTMATKFSGAAGTTLLTGTGGAQTGNQQIIVLQNTATNAQISRGWNITTASSGAITRTATSVDTDAADTSLVVQGTKASAGDTLTLEGWLAEWFAL